MNSHALTSNTVLRSMTFVSLLLALLVSVGCVAAVGASDEDVQFLDPDNKADSHGPRVANVGTLYRTSFRSQITRSGISRLRVDGPVEEGSHIHYAIYRSGGGTDIRARIAFIDQASTGTQRMRILTDEAVPTLVMEFTISFDSDGYLVLSRGDEMLAQLEPIDTFAAIVTYFPILAGEVRGRSPGGPGSVAVTVGDIYEPDLHVGYLQSGTLSQQLSYPCAVTLVDDPHDLTDDATLNRSGTCALLEGGTPAVREYAWVFWRNSPANPDLNVTFSGSTAGRDLTVHLGASTFTHRVPSEEQVRFFAPDVNDFQGYDDSDD